jgi:ubiquinone/menaquinone biosynthesis C-methylase UbiE
MSTYVLMRILESAPRRYDLGIRLLTLGTVGKAYDRLAGHIEAGQRVLDIGCGTGALALRAARRGAQVRGIDSNAEMLEIAAQRARDTGLADKLELVEMGVAELDREQARSYDVITSGLCFSELSDGELAYALEQAMRILKPGGLLLVADEVRQRNLAARILVCLVRTPLAALTWLISQQVTHPIAGLPETLTQAGFRVVSARSGGLKSFAEVVAVRPAGEAP